MRFFYLFFAFIISPVFAGPCGLTGSVDERMKECAQTKGHFALVAVNEKGAEIYKDLKSGLIWGYRIPADYNHYGSQKACSDEFSGYQFMGSLKWRLPTTKEFEVSTAHGMKAALQHTDHSYWTSTPVKKQRQRRRRAIVSQVYIWDGVEDKADVGDLKDAASVRCVARD